MAVVGRPLSVNDTVWVGGRHCAKLPYALAGVLAGVLPDALPGRRSGGHCGMHSGGLSGIRPPSAALCAQGRAADRASVPMPLRADRPPNRECHRWALGARSGRGSPVRRPRRAAAIRPAPSVSITPATVAIEITRYLRAPSFKKRLCALLLAVGTRMAVTI